MRLFGPALAVGLAAPLVWPLLHPVPAWSGQQGLPAGILDSTAGLAAGLLLGCLIGGVWKNTGLLLGTACVGLYLGWQAVGVLAPVTIALDLLHAALGRWTAKARHTPATLWLAVVSLAWILAWAWLWGHGAALL